VDQFCCLESKDHGRFSATIVSIGPEDVSAAHILRLMFSFCIISSVLQGICSRLGWL